MCVDLYVCTVLRRTTRVYVKGPQVHIPCVCVCVCVCFCLCAQYARWLVYSAAWWPTGPIWHLQSGHANISWCRSAAKVILTTGGDVLTPATPQGCGSSPSASPLAASDPLALWVAESVESVAPTAHGHPEMHTQSPPSTATADTSLWRVG